MRSRKEREKCLRSISCHAGTGQLECLPASQTQRALPAGHQGPGPCRLRESMAPMPSAGGAVPPCIFTSRNRPEEPPGWPASPASSQPRYNGEHWYWPGCAQCGQRGWRLARPGRDKATSVGADGLARQAAGPQMLAETQVDSPPGAD